MSQDQIFDINTVYCDWIYSIGIQAFIYLYPTVTLKILQYKDYASKTSSNIMYYFSSLANPSNYPNNAPSTSVLYATAWLNLSHASITLSTPENKNGRWWTVQLIDMSMNTFANVPGPYKQVASRVNIIEGPNTPPCELCDYNCNCSPHNIIKSPTNIVYLVAKVEVRGEGDSEDASNFLQGITISQNSDIFISPLPEILENTIDTLDFFKIGLATVKHNPPPYEQFILLNQFKQIGLDVNKLFDPNELDQITREALTRAMINGKRIMEHGYINSCIVHNSWLSFKCTGNYESQFLLRAYFALNGLDANIKEEQLCLHAIKDNRGDVFDGNNKYKIHFDTKDLPKVNPRWGFWSITLYQDHKLWFNRDYKYSVGTNTGKLSYNHNGSLDIYIQNIKPNRNLIRNWIPCPRTSFTLALVMYSPTKLQLEDLSNLPYVEKI